MSRELYACLYARDFPLQSLVRLRPEFDGFPVAVLDGRAPLETVCSLNMAALQTGAAAGMTRLEAEAMQGLRLLPRSIESEAAARAVFLECAANFSPRIELMGIEEIHGDNCCACVLDIAGTERLFGPPAALARRMCEAFAAAGFRAAVAVSANFHTAMLKAAASDGVSVIAAGQEAAALASLPVDALSLPEKAAETFELWGLRSLGELAALPEVELITRLGQEGKRWRSIARGTLPYLFQPMEPEFSLDEFCEFESPMEQIDSVLFVAARMIDSLVSRVQGHALSLASLKIVMRLEAEGVHELRLHPATTTLDRKFLLKLLHIELASHPPASAIVALTIAAEAGQTNTVQLGLFLPQLPEPSRLDVTLARLKALVGDDRVGSPVLEDSLKTGTFHMEGFRVGAAGASTANRHPRIALRRLRPPHPVNVRCSDQKPIAFYDGWQNYSIAVAYGPWRTSGCWWAAEEWDRDEWDVLIAEEQSAHLLVNHRRQNRWYLEAVYD